MTAVDTTTTLAAVTPADGLADMLDRLVAMKDEIAGLETARRDLEDQIIAVIGDNSPHTWMCDGMRTKATVVRPTVIEVDGDVLETLIPKKVWDSITTRRVETRLFDAQVRVGNISAVVADQVSTVTARRPYVRVTVGGR